MKLVYVVIDGMADRPIEELGNRTPLDAAETPNMDLLAKNGATGLMYTVGKGIAPESDAAVVSILGYDPFKYHTSRGVLEAIGAGLPLRDGDLALRCNFATVEDRNIIKDRRAERNLTVEEAMELAEAINRQVRLESHPASFQFKSTLGHRAVLVMRRRDGTLSSEITNTDPAYTRIRGVGVAELEPEMILRTSKAITGIEEAKISADLVNEFTKKAINILDSHWVNSKRVKEGKLKANAILSRDAGHIIPRLPTLREQYGFNFACLADMPVEKGISKLAGMQVVELPPPSESLEKDSEIRVKRLLESLPRYDCCYVHIKGPDVPGHDGDFELKTRLIEIADKDFLGPVLQKIDLKRHLICVTADHATPCKLESHSDDPVPLLISGNEIIPDTVQKFSEAECRKGRLGIIEHGTELMPMLMKYLPR